MVDRRGAVLFDLDGTLTVKYLDFDAIRAEIGITGGPILEAIADMDDVARARASRILDRHERDAAEASELHPGARETIAALRSRGWRVGIVTRNARRWATFVLSRHGVDVDGLWSREDGAIKPDPAGPLALCAAFGAEPGRSWMVGDYRFDIEAGVRAGMRTVLMIGDDAAPPYAADADYVIRRLDELLGMV
ncbi:MAG: HAD family hydrolase [Phycisphaerales bacterium]|nr:HAD family hydrolase [Phycisphaerales bacterium]